MNRTATARRLGAAITGHLLAVADDKAPHPGPLLRWLSRGEIEALERIIRGSLVRCLACGRTYVSDGDGPCMSCSLSK